MSNAGAKGTVILGHGLSDEDSTKISQMVNESRMWRLVPVPEKEGCLLTHKRATCHVMIGKSARIQPSTYQSDLIGNGSCDRLTDHVTGQHISAMQIIEAARQSMISSLEQEYALCAMPDRHGGFSIILDTIKVHFLRYAFPIPTQLLTSVHGPAVRHRVRTDAEVRVEVRQGGMLVSEVEFSTIVYAWDSFERVERKLAKQALQCLYMSDFDDFQEPAITPMRATR